MFFYPDSAKKGLNGLTDLVSDCRTMIQEGLGRLQTFVIAQSLIAIDSDYHM